MEDAKKALSKAKKVEKPHPKDWGHAIFTYNPANEESKENKEKN
jgi:hypothetical protein